MGSSQRNSRLCKGLVMWVSKSVWHFLQSWIKGLSLPKPRGQTQHTVCVYRCSLSSSQCLSLRFSFQISVVTIPVSCSNTAALAAMPLCERNNPGACLLRLKMARTFSVIDCPEGQHIPTGTKHSNGCSPSVFTDGHFLGWESSPCIVLLLPFPYVPISNAKTIKGTQC